MQRFAPQSIASTLLAAPGWARVGLTAPNERLREEAALELARFLVGDVDRDDPRQLVLPL